MPEDVAAELGAYQAESVPADFSYRFAVRRLRDTLNSACRELPSIRARVPFNLAYMHPEDMEAEGLADGVEVEVQSEHGAIRAVVEADSTLRRGVISVTHGFGQLPGVGDYREVGSNTNLLISTDHNLASVNAMPRMSGFPVRLALP